MNIFKFFSLSSPKERSTAEVAKERLQIIVSHESTRRSGSDIIKQLQKEILEVLSKYTKVDQDLIKVQLERNGDQSVLELNVTLPEGSSLSSPIKMNSVELISKESPSLPLTTETAETSKA